MAASESDDCMDVINIIDTASAHKLQLTELLAALDACKKQVNTSAESARQLTKDHFVNLKNKLLNIIEERLDSLLIDIDTARSSALNPLIQCDHLIKDSIVSATSIIQQGGQLLQDNAANSENASENIKAFKKSVDTSAFINLPAVPSLNEVPYICAQLKPSCTDFVLEKISEEGIILQRPPLTITEVRECPGGLNVAWEESEEDSMLDISEFCLRYYQGTIDSSHSPVHHTAYTGSNMSHTVKGLRKGTIYTLRVSCKTEGSDDWLIWSIPWSASTSLPHYQWSSRTGGYSLSNESRMFVREGDITSYPPVIFSTSSMYQTGETIAFRVLTDNDPGMEDGIAVCVDNPHEKSLKRLGSAFISVKGIMYIDGNEMKNKLPPITKGSILTIHTEYLSNGKIRISADIDDKLVTFDWNVEPVTPSPTDCANFNIFHMKPGKSCKQLFFAACFTNENWKISVE